MSQYPPQGNPTPYYQPQYAPVSQASALPGSRACRTAAVVQIVIAALGIVLALCVGAASAMLTAGVIPAEDQAELTEIAQELPISISALLLIVSVCMGLPALVLIVLGLFVWRESRVAIVISLVITGGIIVLNVIGTIAQALTQGADVSLCSNVFSTLVMASLGALLIWALRDLHARDAATRNLYAQWQQYYAAQQQQAPVAPPPPPAPPEDAPLPPPPIPPA